MCFTWRRASFFFPRTTSSSTRPPGAGTLPLERATRAGHNSAAATLIQAGPDGQLQCCRNKAQPPPPQDRDVSLALPRGPAFPSALPIRLENDDFQISERSSPLLAVASRRQQHESAAGQMARAAARAAIARAGGRARFVVTILDSALLYTRRRPSTRTCSVHYYCYDYYSVVSRWSAVRAARRVAIV